MTTQDIFLALTRSVLRDRRVDEAILREWTPDRQKALFRLAKQQDLAPLIGEALTRAGLSSPGDPNDPFQNEMLMAIFRYEGMRHDLEQIGALFDGETIPYIPLKGAVLRDLYPQPWLRTSCDIDVLIHEEDIPRASSLLQEKAGYRYVAETTHDVSLESPGRVHLELHHHTVEDGRVQNAAAVLENVWDHAIPDGEGCRYRLSAELVYVYLLAHTAKHLQGGSCGVRPFLDLWIWRHTQPMEPSVLDPLLETGGLTRFADQAARLGDVWLDGAPPDGVTDRMREALFAGGVYGSTQTISVVQRQKRGGRVRFFLTRIFESRDNVSDYFPPVGKYPFLLPVGWVVRLVKLGTKRGVSQSWKALHVGMQVTGEQIREHGRLMDDLGLNDSGSSGER
ncbi:MAG: nucleotidyltransferase family protein [Acutalibacteraceae bacterium]|jgi:hypothetical protein